jgi:hypothetical protein
MVRGSADGPEMIVKELIEFLQQCDPELEVLGKVSGGCLSILWATDEETDEEGQRVVMIGLDS